MKTLIFVLFALNLTGQKALALDPIDVCNDAPAMAVLAKDNFPVWTIAPKNQISPCFDLNSIAGTPCSQQFEKFPLSHKSQKNIDNHGYKSSHRMLFYDYPTEKRPQNKIQQNPKKDFP